MNLLLFVSIFEKKKWLGMPVLNHFNKNFNKSKHILLTIKYPRCFPYMVFHIMIIENKFIKLKITFSIVILQTELEVDSAVLAEKKEKLSTLLTRHGLQVQDKGNYEGHGGHATGVTGRHNF